MFLLNKHGTSAKLMTCVMNGVFDDDILAPKDGMGALLGGAW